MALTKNHSVNFRGKEVLFSNAYIKIASANANKDKISVTVEIFDRQDGQLVESQAHFFDHDLNGANAIKQAYEQVKKLSQFLDAKDC